MSEKPTELELIAGDLRAARQSLARYLAENLPVQKRAELWNAALEINKAIGHLEFVLFFHQKEQESGAYHREPPSYGVDATLVTGMSDET